MFRNELLEFLKPRVSDYYYGIAFAWTKQYEKRLFWRRRFKVSPPASGNGYVLSAGWLEFIIVYR